MTKAELKRLENTADDLDKRLGVLEVEQTMINARLKDLALKSGAHLLEKLNEWSTDDIRKAIVRYETGGSFDHGIAQFLRLYLTARTIGSVTKRSTP